MAKFVYRCNNCQRGDEYDIPVGTEVPKSQGSCSCGGTMVRVFTAPAIHFKGSGFYSTGKN